MSPPETRSTASLPMYDLPDVAEATEAWFQGLMRHLGEHGIAPLPAARTRDPGDRVAHWSEPGLVLSQTCGHPFATHLSERVRVVAAPVYRIADADGPRYRGSLIVAAGSSVAEPGDLQGAVAAVNGTDSYSGFAALRRVLRPLAPSGPFLDAFFVTGAHPRSLEAVAEGRADCATIDAVTLALIERTRPGLARRVRVLDPGPRAPSLPYITAGGRAEDEIESIRAALAGAVADPALQSARETLLIDDLVARDNADYAVFKDWARAAQDDPIAAREIPAP